MRKPTSPQEIETWYIIPAIRKEFVKSMVKKGLSQKQAAEKLGLTNAAISQYMNNKRGNDIKFTGHIKTEIEKSAGIILKGGHMMKELQRICTIVRKARIVCRISADMGCKPRNCQECFK